MVNGRGLHFIIYRHCNPI